MENERMAALERRVRWLQGYALVATTLVLVGAAVGPVTASFDVVHARQFVVLDENGHSRAVLGMQSEEGRGAEKGSPRSYVALSLEADNARALLRVEDDERPEFTLSEFRSREELTAILSSRQLEILWEAEEYTCYAEVSGEALSVSGWSEEDGNKWSTAVALTPEHGLGLDTRGNHPQSGEYRYDAGFGWKEPGEVPFLHVLDWNRPKDEEPILRLPEVR